MFQNRRRGIALFICLVVAATLGFSAPAQAWSEKRTSSIKMFPSMLFRKNFKKPLNSTLTAYVSVGKNRYRLTMRAGSGNGTVSECIRNKGMLPNGQYSERDRIKTSSLKWIPNKTWGSDVVRGSVWELGSMKCKPKSGERAITRSELFIHSQGKSAWNGNYASNGCIKINQKDRTKLTQRWKAAYQNSRGLLAVY